MKEGGGGEKSHLFLRLIINWLRQPRRGKREGWGCKGLLVVINALLVAAELTGTYLEALSCVI